jgi:hypothetical protein
MARPAATADEATCPLLPACLLLPLLLVQSCGGRCGRKRGRVVRVHAAANRKTTGAPAAGIALVTSA